MDSTSWALAVSMSGFGMLRHLAETGGKSRGHVVARVKSSQVTWLLYLWGADGPHKGVVTRNRRHFHVVYEPHFPLHRPLRIADVPEWSKGFDSSSNSASCTGSNPVVRILVFRVSVFLFLLFPSSYFSFLFSFLSSPPLFLFFHPFFPSLPADAPIGSAPDQRYSFSTLLPASATAPDGSTPRYSSFFFLRAPLRPNLIRGTPFFLLTRYPTRWFDSFLARI